MAVPVESYQTEYWQKAGRLPPSGYSIALHTTLYYTSLHYGTTVEYKSLCQTIASFIVSAQWEYHPFGSNIYVSAHFWEESGIQNCGLYNFKNTYQETAMSL